MPKQNEKTDMIRVLSVGGVCAVTSAMIAMLLTALSTVFIENEYLNIGSSNVLAVIIQLIVTTIGVMIAGRMVGSNVLMQCLVTCGCYVALMLISAMLFFDGVGGLVLPNLLAVLVGGVVAIFLCSKSKNIGKRKKRRSRSR